MDVLMPGNRYCVISPVRNEERDLPKTIDSLSRQTVRPILWVIVDDGSTDQTPAMADRAAEQFSWIQVVHRKDRGSRKQGGGVVETFYDGYPRTQDLAWDFIVKLDGDLSFPVDYFEKCLGKFRDDPRLGIGGGTVCVDIPGKGLVKESNDPRFHVRGATKIYRRECWQGIGDLVRAPGWDTLDELKANMLGWTTYSFSDIQIVHHRGTGSADGAWRTWTKNGRANYITGYHPLFMLAKVLSRISTRPPFFVESVGLFWGYVAAYWQGIPQTADVALKKYIRKQQLRRLCLQSSLWS